MTSADETPDAGRQTPIYQKSAFWFAIALLVRLPAIWFHDFRNADELAFLYLGSGFLHGSFVNLGDGLAVTPPGAGMVLGLTGLLPVAWHSVAGFLMQAIFSAAWVFPIFALTCRRFGNPAGVWAMALVALAHPAVGAAAMLQAEALYMLLLLGALALLEGESPAWRFLSLLMWPCAALTRIEGPFVAVAVLSLTALHNHRRHHKMRRDIALGAGVLTILAVSIYSAFYHSATGDWLYASYLKNAMGNAVADPGTAAGSAELTSLLSRGMGDFLFRSFRHLPGVVAQNLYWWWLAALPSALLLLYPALLLGMWSRQKVLFWTRPRLIAEIDGLDGLIIANLLIFHLVWRAHHHVPMLLLPLLPGTAAVLAGWSKRMPGLLLLAVSVGLFWSGWHVTRAYRGMEPENALAACRLAQMMDEPAITGDIVALDCGGRAQWLGKSDIPFILPGAMPDAWLKTQQRFPDIRFAIYNFNQSGTPEPPDCWEKIQCMAPDQPGWKPVCAYRIPAEK